MRTTDVCLLLQDGRPRARPARPDGLLGALNASSNAGLRDQEARRILAASIGGTIAYRGECVSVCVRPGNVCLLQKGESKT